MTPATIRAVVFDLGNVLIDIDFDRSFAHWGASAGTDPAALRARYATDAAYEAHERDEIDAATYFDALRDALGIALPHHEWLAGWNALLLDEIPGIRAQVERARRRVPVHVFSNTNRAHHEAWAAAHADLLALFEQVLTSSDIGLRKPDPAAFTRVARRIGVGPPDILFLDDLAENVAGARTAGLVAEQVRSPAEVAAVLDRHGF